MTSPTLAAVIPTRNRADMAITAIRALLAQRDCELLVFVSDNSSQEKEVRRLADFCAGLHDPRVTYLRPPENLSQGRHWDWALREALGRSHATHVTIHYDRKIIRPGAAAAWAAVAAQHPEKLFTYVTDFVSSDPPPLRLWQAPWTGKLYAVRTARIAEASARGLALELGHPLPLLSNCFVPRAVVDALVARFGDLCVSTTPDSRFAYRFCALFDDSLHLDRPLSVLYGSHRSAGAGYLKGSGGDFADHQQTWRAAGGEGWLDAAPIPGVNLGCNMLFHEYELVRREAGGDRLPPIEKEGYLRDLARGLVWIRDPQEKARLRALLVEHGWDGAMPQLQIEEPKLRAWHRLSVRLYERITLLRASVGGIVPDNISGFTFRSDEQALRYAMRFPRRPAATAAHLDLAGAAEIS